MAVRRLLLLVVAGLAAVVTTASAFISSYSLLSSREKIKTNTQRLLEAVPSGKDSISAAFQEAVALAESQLDELHKRVAQQDAQLERQAKENLDLKRQVKELQKRIAQQEAQLERQMQENLDLKSALSQQQKDTTQKLQATAQAETAKALEEAQVAFEHKLQDIQQQLSEEQRIRRELEAINEKQRQDNQQYLREQQPLESEQKSEHDRVEEAKPVQKEEVKKEEAQTGKAQAVETARIEAGEERKAALKEARKAEQQAKKEAEEKAKQAREKAEEDRKAALEAKRVQEEARKVALEARKAEQQARKEAEEKARREAKEKAQKAREKAQQERQAALEARNAELEAKKKAAQEALEAKKLASQQALGIPVLNEWLINDRGEVTGLVTGHPTIPDGNTIKTSPLANPGAASDQKTVTTESGSKYRLGAPKGSVGGGSTNFGAKETTKSQEKIVYKNSRSSSVDVDTLDQEIRDQEICLELGLTGQTAGENGKYLLAGKPTPSTNNRSMLYTAYQSDSRGMPKGNALAIKVSSNKEGMEREHSNYRKVTGGFGNFKKGMFVVQKEYMSQAGGSLGTKQSALVMERGSQDLRKYVAEHGPLEGRNLRDAASSAIQCIEALHNAGLVWTDLKTENFVVFPSGKKGSSDTMTIKGIDLESAMPVKQNPVDYSPEACPPEFAKAHLVDESTDFTLEYSYDIWSLGMFLYELATGENYFAAQPNPSAIIKVLPDLEEPIVVGVEAIKDKNMADLISKCLSVDPAERPQVGQLLLHPYFLTTGFGPFSF